MATDWLNYFGEKAKEKGLTGVVAVEDEMPDLAGMVQKEAKYVTSDRVVYQKELSKKIENSKAKGVLWFNHILAKPEQSSEAHCIEVAYSIGFEIETSSIYALLMYDILGDKAYCKLRDYCLNGQRDLLKCLEGDDKFDDAPVDAKKVIDNVMAVFRNFCD